MKKIVLTILSAFIVLSLYARGGGAEQTNYVTGHMGTITCDVDNSNTDYASASWVIDIEENADIAIFYDLSAGGFTWVHFYQYTSNDTMELIDNISTNSIGCVSTTLKTGKAKIEVYNPNGQALTFHYHPVQSSIVDDITIRNSVTAPGNVVVTSDGNVGIGVNDPTYKLDVNGTICLARENAENLMTWEGSNLLLRAGIFSSSSVVDIKAPLSPNSQGCSFNMYRLGNQMSYTKMISLNTHSHVWFKNSGNFGIGTSNPQYKLDVIGAIHANEIVVDMSGADFVFDNSYRLRPLAEVADYVQVYKHLPEIQSAAEMQENGVSVSGLQTQLLQKIEELTLYLIQQDKEISNLKQQIETLTSNK